MSRVDQIRPAVRKGLPAKVLLAGPSGSGKTWDALTIATTLGSDIVLIDTEHGRASLYADRFEFELLEWVPPYSPTELADAIGELNPAYEVIVIDSLSHFWMGEGGTLDIVDRAAAKARGNTYAGWKEGTPAQQAMYEAILSSPRHIVATVRSKQDYVLEDRGGKQVPVKVGMAPVQRDGAEYEFDVQAEIDMEHRVVVGKTRCSALDGKVYRPAEVPQLASTLVGWLDPIDPEAAQEIADALNAAGKTARAAWLDEFGGRKPHELRSTDEKAAREFLALMPDEPDEGPGEQEAPAPTSGELPLGGEGT